MKKTLAIIVFSIGFSFAALGQNMLRHFMQAPIVVNAIPYGNNPQAGHYAKTNDAKIYYELYGQGQPILLLHGGMFGSTIELGRIIDSLKTNFQVIAISTRGHGKSELGTEPTSLEQRVNDVCTVLNEVTAEKVLVLGFSDGGYTAYTLAVMHPEKVKKMIVIGAGVVQPGQREFTFNFDQAIALDKDYWDQQRKLMPEPNRLEEMFQKIAACYNRVTIGKTLLSKIECPVLVMAGDRDDGNSVQNVLNAALLIPNHQLAIIPNAGHPAFIINFNAVWASITPFINEK